MKGKKEKNVSVQISLYSIIDEISKPQYLAQFKNHPQILADQIDDIKTLLSFASSNYTHKARTLLNMTKQFTKSIEYTLDGVNAMDIPLYQMPQTSYPQLAYQTLKRSTTLQLEQQSNQLDWRAVYSEYQLKFMESKNICGILQWEKCYNSQQRCIQISKSINDLIFSHHSILSNRQGLQKPIQIDLTLKIQTGRIVWHIKKVMYHNSLHYPLLGYYQNELMAWVRENHSNNLQESEKHVLSLLHKSIDYIDVILLFIQLKNMPFNKDIDTIDMKNGILNLFAQPQTLKHTYLKNKNIKICFMLPYSISPPSVIIRANNLNILKLEFTQKNEIQFKLKLKHKEQEATVKKLVGSIKKKRLSLQVLLTIVHEVLQGFETYGGLVEQIVEQWRMDLFLGNRTTSLMFYSKSVDCALLQEGFSENEAINLQIKYNLSTHHISDSGMYIIFTCLTQSYLPPIISYLSPCPQLFFKTPNTEFGFINKLFKHHPTINFQQAMLHIHLLEQVQIHQQLSGWNIKLMYLDIYLVRDIRSEWIVYKFKQMGYKKPINQNPIVKRDAKLDHSSLKDYSVHLKIHENFKSVQFIFVTPNQIIKNQNSQKPTLINNGQFRPQQSFIPQKYFKSTWKQYIKKRNESQLLKNQYLDVDQVLKAAHYIFNHLDFNRYIKNKAQIFRNQDMVQLMDS